MSLEQLTAIHERMQLEAARAGGALDAVLFCPHAPEAGCACRKPAPGLIHTAIAAAGIPATETIVVGDDKRDIDAASRAGVSAVLVRTGKGRNTEALLSTQGVRIYDDLLQLALAITAQ